MGEDLFWAIRGGVELDLESYYHIRSSLELYSYMTPFVSNSPRGAYLNYRDIDIGISHNGIDSYEEGKVYGAKYFMNNFDRLVKVKTVVDPQNFFSCHPRTMCMHVVWLSFKVLSCVLHLFCLHCRESV
ncbi:unnamed protein product, partial [Vitis vinifera]